MENANNISKEEQDRMFDIAESIVMQYMSYYLDVPVNDLFIDKSNIDRKIPLCIKPIEKYSDKNIAFSLQLVPHDYKLDIPDELKEAEEFKKVIGFIYYSVMVVFNSLLKINIKYEKMHMMAHESFNMELDDEAFAFYPVYMFPPKRMHGMLLQMKESIESDIKRSDDPSLHKQLEELNLHLGRIQYSEEEASEHELAKNNELKEKKRIGIFVDTFVPST